MLPRGKITDFGDLIHEERWIIKGRHFRLGFRLGAPRERPDGWEPGPSVPIQNPTGKVDLIMDLLADKEFDLGPEFSDEMGNPVSAPADLSVAYTLDTTEFVELIDLGEGRVTVGALGGLGTTNIHSVATFEGRTVEGDLQVVTVAGLAERMEMVAGEQRERTADV